MADFWFSSSWNRKDITESVISSIADPLIIIGGKGKIRKVNRAFLDLLGYSEDYVIKRPFDEFYELTGEPIEVRLKKEGRLTDCDLKYINKKGERIPVSFSASILKGEPESIVAVAKDLRERQALIDELRSTKEELAKRVDYLEDFREGVLNMIRELDESERELEEAYVKLKETQAQLIQSSKMTALGELAAGLAHELNQPLTVIKGLASNLLKTVPEASPQHEKARLIADASTRMEKVIKHLSVFSRLEGPQFQYFDLNSVIKDAFIILKESLATSRIEVKVELAPLPPVLGSPTRLEQVVINLVTNAKDAMPEGGTLYIKTESFESGGKRMNRATFRDSGHGIPEEHLKRIFDPFFTTKEVGKGTGLGLSISYGIVQEHKGELTVESRPGEGAAFHITLPAADVD